jgi:hypothetical protein
MFNSNSIPNITVFNFSKKEQQRQKEEGAGELQYHALCTLPKIGSTKQMLFSDVPEDGISVK